MKKRFVLSLFFIFIIVLHTECKSKSYKIEIERGIKTIHNFKSVWKNKGKIKLKLSKKINFKKLSKRPWDFVLDKRGNKYVLTESLGNNLQKYEIIKFDSNWKYIKKFEKKKEDLYEFIRPRGLIIDKNSNLYIIDDGSMMVYKFNPEGKYQGNIKITYSSDKGCILSTGEIILIGRSFYSKRYGILETKNPTMLVKINSKGKILKKFVKCKKYSNSDLLYLANEIDFDIDEEDNIYVTFEHQNRIEKYTPEGKLLFSATRMLNYKVIHKIPDKKYFIEFPKLTFVSLDISIDSKKRLWVTTFKKQPENQGTRASTLRDHKILKFEIFNSEGILLGEIPVPVRFRKKRIYKTDLYLVDPYFEMSIYDYKIVSF